jgi:tetratricopeptide (TPR) repeat protein
MSKNHLHLKLSELVAELKGLPPAQQVSILSDRARMEVDPLLALEMKIMEAEALADMGREHEAILLLDECSRSPAAGESAAYLAAEILVQNDRFREAVQFLEKSGQQIERSGSIYYRNCIYLLHAYCVARLGDFNGAQRLLEKLQDRDGDEEMPWLRTRPVISVSAVEALIASGSNGNDPA